MLSPQSNPFRQHVDLSGFWELRFDPANDGHSAGWTDGFSAGRPVAVPASWNDQFEEGRDYLGRAWYQTTFDLPWGWDPARQHIRVRFGSANYLAEVWLNGVRLGEHEGGHLPFEFDLSPYVWSAANRLVVCVEGELAPDRVPLATSRLILSIRLGMRPSRILPLISFPFADSTALFCCMQRQQKGSQT